MTRTTTSTAALRLALLALILGAAGSHAAAQTGFVNWESPHVHPIDLTPDGTRLLAVNTADNRLEVFDLTSGAPVRAAAIPVGLDPVSVRARNNTEAWVVNAISDSVSVVDLSSLNVRATLPAGDEPSDVVFAQGRAFVSVSQFNQVLVFDPSNLAAAPTVLPIAGEAPRALATDGARVFAAILESGNRTTIIDDVVVSSAINPYPGDPNPPPNSGTMFNPEIDPGLPTPPRVGLILKKQPDGTWRDDNNGDWTPAVGWDLHDHDVAIIDAATLGITYATGLMNANMALSVGPGGQVTVVGTDAMNHIRFEPVVNGTFVRVLLARFDPGAPAATVVSDLNPHLTYTTPNIPEAQRVQSVGDPRGITWNAAGTIGYVTGMGSNNLIVLDGSFNRIGRLADIGDGPTGVVLDEPRGRAYVMSKFAGSIAVIDTGALALVGNVSFHDPTPPDIAAGRHYLYNTHFTSGLGQAACASCHIDGRMDQLAWDLGDPAGMQQPFTGNCSFGIGGCENWHPMKGPLVTQTLIGIMGTEPLHWRGDRAGINQFNAAFVGLQGRNMPLEPGQIGALSDLVASFTPPPHPYRHLDGSLQPSPPVPRGPHRGQPPTGLFLFQNALLDGGVRTCVFCHVMPEGTTPQVIVSGQIQETQSFKVPQLRNLYYKTGFDKASSSSNRGFGYTHDGADDSLIAFFESPFFRFSNNAAVAAQQRKDIEALMYSFSTDTHAAVGVQTTVADGAGVPGAQLALVSNMITLAHSGQVGLVVKGVVAGQQRGYVYESASGSFRSDRASEALLAPAGLLALAGAAGPGSELTYTVVPFISRQRIGIDRDADGFLDRSELDVCADPANPRSYPGGPGNADADGNGVINPADVAAYVNLWIDSVTNGGLAADQNGDNLINPADVAVFINAWFAALTSPC